MRHRFTHLVVDGHAGVREALAQRLARRPEVRAALTADGIDATEELLPALRPDVVIVDPKTLAADMRDAVRVFAEQRLPVVVLTASLQGMEAAALRRAGAASVLLKGACAIPVLLECVEGAAHAARRGPSAPAGEQSPGGGASS